MNNKQGGHSATPQKIVRGSKKQPDQINMSKKIQRKPSTKLVRSPKHKISELKTENTFEDHLNAGKFQNSMFSSRSTKVEVDCIRRSICYVSPKQSKINTIFQSALEQPKNYIQQLSQNEVSIQLIDLNQSIERPRLSETIKGRPFRSIRLSQNNKSGSFLQRNNSNSKLKQRQQLDDEIAFLINQNKQLMFQNLRLNERINDLNKQKMSLNNQLDQMGTFLKNTKDANALLINQNKKLKKQIQDEIKHNQQTLQNFKYQENLRKNYQILERMYKKIKEENDAFADKNKFLTTLNTKLSNRVVTLSKMLDNVPIKPKQRSKSKGRELSPIYDKQNYSSRSSGSLASNSTVPTTPTIKIARLAKSNRKQDDFFQLSPQ